MTSVIAVGVFVAGIGFFHLSARDERAVWYGLPTAYIALAAFAEVEPRVALFTGLGVFLLQAFIGGLQMAWDARTPTEGYVPPVGPGAPVAPVDRHHRRAHLRAPHPGRQSIAATRMFRAEDNTRRPPGDIP